jgi:nucleoside diphosphate kinase
MHYFTHKETGSTIKIIGFYGQEISKLVTAQAQVIDQSELKETYLEEERMTGGWFGCKLIGFVNAQYIRVSYIAGADQIIPVRQLTERSQKILAARFPSFVGVS